MSKTNSVTVLDVARQAGVAVGTVSRVLNGMANISEENIRRVNEAIELLGYKRRQTDVNRRTGGKVKTGTIGVLFSEMAPSWSNHPLFSAYTIGIERACQEKGYHTLVEMATDSGTVPRCVREGKVEGLLIKSTRRVPDFVKDLPTDFPVVGLSFIDPTASIHQVAMDSQGAGWTVVDYLWKQGHRRIAFVCTDMTHPMFIARLQGYESFLRQRDALHSELVIMRETEKPIMVPYETPPDLTEIVDELFAAPHKPSAIVAANDWMACGLYRALEKKGLRIPADVSVVGFDNSPGLCTTIVPPLTSYQLAFTETAYAATLSLIERIAEPAKRSEISIQLVRGRLIERASVAPIPSVAA